MRHERIEESATWFFLLFHSDKIPSQCKELVRMGFSAGCLLIAAGEKEAGKFICMRVMNQVIDLVPGVQTKCREVMRYLPKNPRRFAGSVASNLELNKRYMAINHVDEIELLKSTKEVTN